MLWKLWLLEYGATGPLSWLAFLSTAQFFNIYSYFLTMSLHMCLCTECAWWLWGPEVDLRSGVTDVSPMWVLRTEPGSSAGAAVPFVMILHERDLGRWQPEASWQARDRYAMQAELKFYWDKGNGRWKIERERETGIERNGEAERCGEAGVLNFTNWESSCSLGSCC